MIGASREPSAPASTGAGLGLLAAVSLVVVAVVLAVAPRLRRKA